MSEIVSSIDTTSDYHPTKVAVPEPSPECEYASVVPVEEIVRDRPASVEEATLPDEVSEQFSVRFLLIRVL